MASVAADIRRAAMDLLARREQSWKELNQKLSKRFPDEPDQIECQLDRLREEGLQSDFRMAESFIRYRANRGQGPIKISMELKRLGISDQCRNQALDVSEIDWLTHLRELCEQKYGSVDPVDLKEKARRSRFLQQRGFSFDMIRQVLG
jgi:regulatory protein